MWKERYGESYRPIARRESVVFQLDEEMQQLLEKLTPLKPVTTANTAVLKRQK